VHRYYQEQYQFDGGKMDRYVTGSDSAGTVMGAYNTKALPIYAYLHEDLQAPPGQLHQAARRGERASRLCQRGQWE